MRCVRAILWRFATTNNMEVADEKVDGDVMGPQACVTFRNGGVHVAVRRECVIFHTAKRDIDRPRCTAKAAYRNVIVDVSDHNIAAEGLLQLLVQINHGAAEALSSSTHLSSEQDVQVPHPRPSRRTHERSSANVSEPSQLALEVAALPGWCQS